MPEGESVSAKLMGWVALALLAMIAYEIYSGVSLKKVGVPGLFEVELADKPAAAVPAPGVGMSATGAGVAANPVQSIPASPPPAQPALSRTSFLGRWRVEQAAGGASASTEVDYHDDGTFNGWMEQFVGGYGQRVPIAGHWNVAIRTQDTFFLTLDYSNLTRAQATFRVLDADHVQNIDQNYVAVRVK